jgi:hypothetical protein
MAKRLHSRFLAWVSQTPRAWFWLGAFIASGFLWVLIIWGVTVLVSAADFRNDPSYQPPKCEEAACPMYGPGGLVVRWKLAVLTARTQHKPIVVPDRAVCASACAIAVGYGLGKGFDVSISPSARFVPHNLEAIRETPMPHRFKAKMLANRPFNWP